MNPRSRLFVGALLAVLLPVVGGCAGMPGALTPSASVTTAVQGWESWLSLDWERTGQEISGYVNSKHGTEIINVQLLAQSLDANGNVVGQKVEWVRGTVPAKQRAYFRIANMPPAASYRVTVWSFDLLESVGTFL